MKVKSIRSIGFAPVYDVITDGTNENFILENGIVAHNCNSTQPALRGFMEEFASNCRFILTCNFKNRIIEALHSRCSVIDFSIANSEKPTIAHNFYKRIGKILQIEGIEFDRKVVFELITKHFPDYRRIINELQRYSVSGKIDIGVLVNLEDGAYRDLIKHLKDKNFTEMRKWVGKNTDIESVELFRKFYDKALDFMEKESIPQMVLILAEYQYKVAFVADREINTAAALTEIMGNCKFK